MDRREFALREIVGSVLDVGAADAAYIWDGDPPPRVVCLDVDHGKHIHVVARAEALPFVDRSFDTVLLMEILEHVEDVRAVLSEALRVARTRVVASYPNEARPDFRTQRDYEEHIEGLQRLGMRVNMRMPRDEEGFVKSHYHWKDRNRIDRDVTALRSDASRETALHYGLYPGWGFVWDLR